MYACPLLWGAGGWTSGARQLFLPGECVEPGAAGGCGLGERAGERAGELACPWSLGGRACPAGGTGCGCFFPVALRFFHRTVNVVEGIFNAFTLKVCAFYIQAFFHGNVSPASGLTFCCIFPLKVFDQVP